MDDEFQAVLDDHYSHISSHYTGFIRNVERDPEMQQLLTDGSFKLWLTRETESRVARTINDFMSEDVFNIERGSPAWDFVFSLSQPGATTADNGPSEAECSYQTKHQHMISKETRASDCTPKPKCAQPSTDECDSVTRDDDDHRVQFNGEHRPVAVGAKKWKQSHRKEKGKHVRNHPYHRKGRSSLHA